jgi:hypothetical protein
VRGGRRGIEGQVRQPLRQRARVQRPVEERVGQLDPGAVAQVVAVVDEQVGDRPAVGVDALRQNDRRARGGRRRLHGPRLVEDDVVEADLLEQPVAGDIAPRLRLAAVVRLGRVYSLEAQLDAAVHVRGANAVAAVEVVEQRGPVRHEPDRVAVGALADDGEIAAEHTEEGHSHERGPH